MSAPLHWRDSTSRHIAWLAAAWYPLLFFAFPMKGHEEEEFLAMMAVSLGLLLWGTVKDYALWSVPAWGMFLGNWVIALLYLAGRMHFLALTSYVYMILEALALPVLVWQMWVRRKDVPRDAWAVLVLFFVAAAASELAFVPPGELSSTALLGMFFFASLEIFAVTVGLLQAEVNGARAVAVAALAEFFIGVMLIEPDYALAQSPPDRTLVALEALPVFLIPLATYFCRSGLRAAWISWGISLAGMAGVVALASLSHGTGPDMAERFVLVSIPIVLATLLAVRVYPAMSEPENEEVIAWGELG